MILLQITGVFASILENVQCKSLRILHYYIFMTKISGPATFRFSIFSQHKHFFI